MVVLAKKQIKEGQIYITSKESAGKRYIYTVKCISPKKLVLYSNTNKETISDIEDIENVNFIGANLIKEYPSWQEAINSKEFRAHDC